MNISGVSSPNPGQFRPRIQEQPLTDEQKKVISDILSKYDPSNMIEEDKENMRNELKNAGIKPSRELGKMLKEAGFTLPPSPKDEEKMSEDRENNLPINENQQLQFPFNYNKGTFIDTEI